jgi:hypothetical protein
MVLFQPDLDLLLYLLAICVTSAFLSPMCEGFRAIKNWGENEKYNINNFLFDID